jgi:hypothetical protein
VTQLTTLEKQSYEERIFEFDLSGLMATAATIASVVSVVSVNQNLVGGSSNVTISGEVASGQSVKALFVGGTSQELYKITCKAIDTDGQKLEWDGYLAVRDV